MAESAAVHPGATSPSQPRDDSPFPRNGFYGSRLDREGLEGAWIWKGFIAPGNVTLLTSQWKSGKTTLLSVLLSRLKNGGILGGQEVMPAKAVIVSEEAPCHWRPRHRKLDLSDVFFFCRPFRGKPSLPEWLGLVEDIARLRTEKGMDLLVIDTLSTFLPGRNEANAGVMMEALMPLQKLTEMGMAILQSHHPGKGKTLPGQAARGSGALPAFADIIMEMSWCSHAVENDRRRKILAFSRSECTPAQIVLELNAEGTDYLTHGTFHDDEFTRAWLHLRLVLEDAPGKRTRRQLLQDWPADFPAPTDNTLWRWLQRAVALKLVCQEGTGRKNDPFLYWLPDQEAKWRKDPLYEMERQYQESLKMVEATFGMKLRP